MEWYNPFEHNKLKKGSANFILLRHYITNEEEEFSREVNLTKEEVHMCIGMFLSWPKLDRNKEVHLFGMWELLRGSKRDCISHGFELSPRERESLQPKPIDFTIEEVRKIIFVINDLVTHLDELPSYYQHQATAIRAIAAFVLKELNKACGKARLKVLELYNQLGTNRVVAAADMVQTSAISLGFSLRQAIAHDLEKLRISRGTLFGKGKVFWQGDLKDVNYTSAWW
ncbi:hypothetical protein GOP47_0011114 [Adiantum capillus-veneris]|uniref:Uncharacterized protein n=1 Tax=Adiantum capillus-veneris TaxID=13818 RepID=A0A9D4USB2_ADICA|nr:hypothetical protein GOP47_0011114 [Adiantum capillus-veneris]